MYDDFIFGDYVKIDDLRPEGCLINIEDEDLMESIDCYFGGYTTQKSNICFACKSISPKTAALCRNCQF